MKRSINTSTLLENWKKLWDVKVIIIPIGIGAFGTVTKGLLKGLKDLKVGRWAETNRTTTLLKTARLLRRVQETWRDLLSFKLHWKPSANADGKNSNNNNNNDTIKQVEMKDKILKEYLRRTRKLFETKLSRRKLIKRINTCAVLLIRYSGPLLKWTSDELKKWIKEQEN